MFLSCTLQVFKFMSNHIVSSMFVLSGIKRLTVLKMLAATFPLCSQAINSTASNTPGEKCSKPEDEDLF